MRAGWNLSATLNRACEWNEPDARAVVEALECRRHLSAVPAADAAPAAAPLVTVKWGGRTGQAAAGEWVVRVSGVGGGTESQAEARLQKLLRSGRKDVEVLDRDPASGYARIRVAASAGYDGLSKAFARLAGFKSIVPNIAYAASAVPNDPQYGSQWSLNNTGQTGGVADADIDAPEAWNLTTGDSSVIVAVLDTGVRWDHPDLAGNIWTNPGEIPGNLIDDDRDGIIDDVRGYDFVNDDADPTDDHGHGTHVAGTIAAAGNNAVGVTGVAPGVKILPLKFLSAGGIGYAYNVVKAVNYVTRLRRDHGVNVRVLNCSFGGSTFDQASKDALTAAGEAGILTVAAAGNSGNNTLYYPAALNLPTELSVAATDASDALASFSTYGSTVQIGAPGVSILSTVPWTGGIEAGGGGYRTMSGTSMAAPHVAGVAALAFTQAVDATPAEIRAAIIAGGDTKSSLGGGKTATGKRLNALGTLNQLGIRVKSATPAAGDTVTTAPTEFTVRFSEPIAAASIAASDLTVNGVPATSFAFSAADPRTITFAYATSPVTAAGPQAMAVAAAAVSRAADNGPVKAWSSTFMYDPAPLAVVSASLVDGADVAAPLTALRLTFNRDVDLASVAAADLALSTGTVTGVTGVDARTVEFALGGLTNEGFVEANLGAGKVLDSVGNRNAAWVNSYLIDRVDGAFGGTMFPLGPGGAQAYRGRTTGFIGTGADADRFTLGVDPGQVLSVAVKPAGDGLRPTVAVLDPSGATVGTATASAVGQTVVLNAAAAAAGGTYTVVVGSAAATLPTGGGSYEVELALNATLEREGRSGAANDALADAEDLDPAFTAPGGVRRTAALGRLPAAAGTADWYKLTVPAGASPTFVVTGQTPDALPRVAVYTAAGALATAGVATPNGQAVVGFTAAAAGTYYARVTGAGGEYLLSVADAAFDLEPNDAQATAVDLGGRRAAIGYATGQQTTALSAEVERNDDGTPGVSLTDLLLANDASAKWNRASNSPVNEWKTGTISGTISAPLDGDWDFHRFFAGPGDTFTARERTAPGAGVLNPYLRLFDNTGKLLAFDDETAGGQSDAQITYSAFSYVGDYYIVPDAFHQAVNPGYLLELTIVTPTLRRAFADDHYKLTLAAGQTVTLRTNTPSDGLGEFANTLDPSIALLSPAGATVASNDNGAADGRNAVLTYTAPSAGTYAVAVRAAANTRGEYVLTVTDGGTTVAPGAPAAPDLAAASDTGPLADDDVTRLTSGLAFRVPGVTPGATVILYDGATAIGSAVATAAEVVVTTTGPAGGLTNGVHTVTAKQQVGAGPVSAASPPLAIVVDATAPAAPAAAPDLRAASDTGVSATDDLTNDNTPGFDVATADGYFRAFVDGLPLAGVFGPGTSFTLPELPDGPHAVAVAAVDLAGNESAPSAAVTVTVDTAAPAAPGAPDLRAAADSGLSDADNVTNVQQPAFDIATSGPYLRLYRGDILASLPYAAAPVTASVPQPDGTWAYAARAVDAAGNASAPGPVLNVTIDTLAWAPAVSGGKDPTWGTGGYTLTALGNAAFTADLFSGGNARIEDLVLMPDNRVLAVGRSPDPSNGVERITLAMYRTDGTLDPAFGSGGVTGTNVLAASTAFDTLVLPDGKILVAATANTSATNTSRGTSRMVLARYLPNGTIDTAFGAGGTGYVVTMIGGSMTNAVCITRQLDGKILVGGDANDATTDMGIARYNADGTLDMTFGLGGKVEVDFGSIERANALLVQADGKVVAVGTTFVSGLGGGAQAIAVARLNADGSLDTSYGTGGRRTISLGYTPDVAYDAVLTADGKAVIVGSRKDLTYTDGFLIRLDAGGRNDTTFGSNGIVLTSFASGHDWFTDVTLQADGRILAAGTIAGRSDMTVGRFLPDGTPDPTFGANGQLVVDIAGNNDASQAVAVQRDGKIVLGGYSRSTTSGSVDAFAVVRIGNGAKMKSPKLKLSSDTGTPGDNVTSASALAFDIEPTESFYRFYQDGQQLAGGYRTGTEYTAAATAAGTFAYTYTTVDLAGNESIPSEPVQVTVTLTAPAVRSAAMADGGNQRSRVSGMTVTFDRAVTPAAGAFAVARRGGGATVGVAATNPSGDGATWLLSFTGAGGAPLPNGSLPDGVYDLTVVAAAVRAGGPTGPAMAADYNAVLHRLAGDATGDGKVDVVDLGILSTAYGSAIGGPGWSADADFTGDGKVDVVDLGILSTAYGADLTATLALPRP